MQASYLRALLLASLLGTLPGCVVFGGAEVQVKVVEAIAFSDVGGEAASDGTWVQFFTVNTTTNKVLKGTRRPGQPWQIVFNGQSIDTPQAIALMRALGAGGQESRRQEILELLNQP